MASPEQELLDAVNSDDAVRVAALVAQEPQIVPGFRVLQAALHGVIDQREGALEIADLVQRAAN